jgi:hypothetical protein
MEVSDARMGHNKPPVSELLADRYKALTVLVEDIATKANATAVKVESDADLESAGVIVRAAKSAAKDAETARVAEKEPYLSGGRAVDEWFKTLTTRLERIATAFEKGAGEYQRRKADEARREALERARREKEEADRLAAEAAEAEALRMSAEVVDATLDAAVEMERAASFSQAESTASNRELSKVETATVTASLVERWTFEITDPSAIPLDRLKGHFARDSLEKAVRSFVTAGNRDLPGVRIFTEAKSSFR